MPQGPPHSAREEAQVEVERLEARLAAARERLREADASEPGAPAEHRPLPPVLQPEGGVAADYLGAMPVISWVKNGDGRHLLANAAMHRWFEAEEGGLVGRLDDELGLPEADLDQLRRHDDEVKASGEPFCGVERLTLADGERRAWYVAKFPLPARPGRERLWGGFAAEISGAFEYEEQLAMALEAGDGGTWVWERRDGKPGEPDRDAGRILFSERCWRMLGLEPETEPSSSADWRERMHPDDRPELMAHLDEVLAGRVNRFQRELRFRHADGGWRWIRTVGRTTRRDPQGRPLRMVGLHLDVDRLKTAESALTESNRRLRDEVDLGMERLRESEARFVSMAKSSPLMLWFTQDGGGHLWLNPALERYLGDEKNGFTGREILGAWIDSLERGTPEGQGTPETMEKEVSVLDAQGRTRWILLHGRARHTATGGWLGHVGTVLDVTEQHEARAALETSKQQLEEEVSRQTVELRERVAELASRNTELDHFAHVASHDLRSPLRTITGFTGYLKPAVAGDAEAEDFIERILRASGRMAKLLDSLLAFASVGRGDFQPRPVGLDHVLGEVLEDLAEEVRRLGASVEIAPLPRVVGDETMLRQAFQNLVGNAIKYAGGNPPRVGVSASELPGEERIRITVADAGLGFAPESAERLFEPFRRFHGEEVHGSGVGLSIVKRVIERHGGRVSAEVVPDEPLPTRFHVDLPAAATTGG